MSPASTSGPAAARLVDSAGAGAGALVPAPGSPVMRNEVLLMGRLSAPAEERVLPSGDIVVTFRLIVARPQPARGRPSGPRVDTLDCAVWTARLRGRALRLAPGSVLEITGRLRRRFWRTGGGSASRVEVEVTGLRRVRA